MKKKILAIALAAIMAVVAITGASLAWLTDTDDDVNVMVIGDVEIVQNELDENGDEFEDGQKLLPGAHQIIAGEESIAPNAIYKRVSVTNTGDEPVYVRTIFAFENTLGSGKGHDGAAAKIWIDWKSCDDVEKIKWWNEINGGAENGLDCVEINGKYYSIGVYTYVESVEPEETTHDSLVKFWLDASADEKWYELIKDEDGGYTYDILVLSQAVQSNGWLEGTTSAQALDEAFGAITAENVAEWLASVADEEFVPQQ